MLLTVVHSNLTTDGLIHVHRAGCADIKRHYRPSRSEVWDGEFASQVEVATDWYVDIIEENPGTTGASYLREFKFLPCCSTLPTDTNPATPKDTAVNTTTATATPKTRTRHALNPDVAGFLKAHGIEFVDAGHFVGDDAEMFRFDRTGWIVRDLENPEIASPIVTEHEALRLLRDWDGEPFVLEAV